MKSRQMSVITACFLLLSLSVSSFAQERVSQLYTGTLDGTTGLFKTWDAENLQQGETNFTFGYDQFRRDPGQLKIGRTVAGAAVGVIDRVEIFGSVDIQRNITADNILYNNSALTLARTPDGYTYFTQDAPFIGMNPSKGPGDFRIGGRANILSERRGDLFSFAVAGLGTIPMRHPSNEASLRRGVSKGTYDFGAFALVSKTATDFIRFHANVGMNFVGEPKDTLIEDDLAGGQPVLRAPILQNEFIWRGGAEALVYPSVYVIAEATGTFLIGDRDPLLEDTLKRVEGATDPSRTANLIVGVRYYPIRSVSLNGAYQATVFPIQSNGELGVNRGKSHGFIIQATFGMRRE